jgi:hypothetical protein
MFDRKQDLVPDILESLSFQTNEDEFKSGNILQTIEEEILKDRQYRLDQSSF